MHRESIFHLQIKALAGFALKSWDHVIRLCRRTSGGAAEAAPTDDFQDKASLPKKRTLNPHAKPRDSSSRRR